MMRFGDEKPPAKSYGGDKPPMGEEPAEESDGDQLGAMAGKKAGAALASALDSGDGAAIYAAFKKLNGLCRGAE